MPSGRLCNHFQLYNKFHKLILSQIIAFRIFHQNLLFSHVDLSLFVLHCKPGPHISKGDTAPGRPTVHLSSSSRFFKQKSQQLQVSGNGKWVLFGVFLQVMLMIWQDSVSSKSCKIVWMWKYKDDTNYYILYFSYTSQNFLVHLLSTSSFEMTNINQKGNWIHAKINIFMVFVQKRTWNKTIIYCEVTLQRQSSYQYNPIVKIKIWR